MEQNKGLTFSPFRTIGTTGAAPEIDLSKFTGKQAKKTTQVADNYFSTPTGTQKLNVSWNPIQFQKFQSALQSLDTIPIEVKDPLYNINRWDAGYNGLNDTEKKQFINQNAAYLKGVNNEYIDRMWRNQQFVKTFGKDAFYQLTPEDRDNLYEDKITADAIKTKFSTNENLGQLLSLTPEGRKELLKSGYKNDYLIKSENEEQDNKNIDDYSFKERLDAITSKTTDLGKSTALTTTTLGAFMGMPAIGFIAGGLGGMLAGAAQGYIHPEENNKNVNAVREQNNNAILEDIIISDNERKKNDSKDDINAVADSITSAYNAGNITKSQIDSEFDNIVLNGKRIYVDELGKVRTFDYQGSNYYSAFKDSSEFEHFNTNDKIKVLAQAQVLSKKYGQNSALQVIDQDMHNYVTGNQNGWDWIGNDLKNIWVGGVAYGMQNILALGAIGATLSGNESLAKFLNGNTEEGEDKYAGWFNPQYWNKVDQYNTFDTDVIKQADANGGISIYNNAYAPGTENDFWSWSTLNEAVKMNKFIWVDLLKNIGLAKGVSLLAKATGGISLAPGVLATESSALSKGINAVGSFGVLNAGSLGIDFAYGLNTYNDVLQENNAKLDKIIDQDTAKDVEAYLNTDAAKKEFMGLVNAENQRRKASQGSNWTPVDEKKAWEDYTASVTERIKEKQEELHSTDRQEAQNTAANAYIADATIEHLRMTGTASMFKSFVFDKGTLNALRLNNPYVATTTKEGQYALAKHATKNAALKTIGQNVWGGFYSNYMDDVTVGFAKGFGLQDYNNYLFNKYNPASYGSTIDEYVAPFVAGIVGASDAMTEKRSFLDGFIGALGTITSLSVNPIGALGVKDRMKERAEEAKKAGKGGSISAVELVADVINSPILQAIADAKSKTRITQAEINRVNKILSESSYSLDNITEAASALNSKAATRLGTTLLEAEDAKDKEAFTLASQLLSLQNSAVVTNAQAEPNKAAWSKKKKMAYAINHALDMSFGTNAQAESPYTRAMATLQVASKINKKAKSEEDAQRKQELIDTFLKLDANKSVIENMSDEEKVDFAKDRLKKNADSLLLTMGNMEKLQRKFDKSLMYNQHPEIRNQLMYQYIMDSRWKNRLMDVEEKITGEESPMQDAEAWYKSYIANNDSKTSAPNITIAKYGSQKGYERAIKTQETVVKQVQDAYKKAVEEAKKEADPTKSIRENSRIKAQRAFTKRALNNTLKQEEAKLAGMKKEGTIMESSNEGSSIVSNPFDTVIRTSDILTLPADLRLRMLDDFYREDYSEAQKVEIDKAKDLLMQDGTTLEEAMENVKDAAVLSNRISANKATAKKIMDNPVEATQMLDSIIQNRQKKVIEYFNNKVVAEAFQGLTNPNLGAPVFSSVEDTVPYLNKLSSIVLKALRPKLKTLGTANGVPDKTIDILQDGVDAILEERGKRKKDTQGFNSFIAKAEKVPHTEDTASTAEDGSIITSQITSDRELSNNDKQLLNYALDWAADNDIPVDNLAEELQNRSESFSKYVQERNHGYQTAFNPMTATHVATEVGTVENRVNEMPVDYVAGLAADTVEAYKKHKEFVAKNSAPKETSGEPTSVVSPVRDERAKRDTEKPKEENPANTKEEAVRPDEKPATDDPFGLKKPSEEKTEEAPTAKEEETNNPQKEKVENQDIIQGLEGSNKALKNDINSYLGKIDKMSIKEATKDKLKSLIQEILDNNSFSSMDNFIQKLVERCATSMDYDLMSKINELSKLNQNSEETTATEEVPIESPSNNSVGINTPPSLTQLSTLDLDIFLNAPNGRFEPQKQYIKEHGIVGFLQKLSGFFKSNYPTAHKAQVVFLYDSALAAQVQESMRGNGANYIEELSSPIIMAIEITDANRHLVSDESQIVKVSNNPDGMSREYMPIGFMPANTNNHTNAIETSVGMAAIRNAVDYTKDGVQIVRLTSSSGKKGNGGAIKTSIKEISTHTEDENIPKSTEDTPKSSAHELMIGNLNSPTESLVPVTSEEKTEFDNAIQEHKTTSSSLYKKFRKAFIDRLTVQPVSSTADVSEPKGLFFRIVKGTKDAFNKIVLIKDIASTVSANGKAFIDLLKDIDTGAIFEDSNARDIIYEFSRCGRLFNKLNALSKDKEISSENYVKEISKAIDNNFSISGREVQVVSISENDGQYMIRLFSSATDDPNASVNPISELTFTVGKGINQTDFARFLKKTILDDAGNVRMNSNGYPLVKWQVNYRDIQTLTSKDATINAAQRKHARSNFEALFDDGVFEMQVSKLAYPVRSVTVHVNNKMRETLYSTDAPETPAPIVEKPVGEVQSKEGTIDGDSGTVVTSTRETVSSTLPQKIVNTIKQIVENSKSAILTDDGAFYNIAGKLWSRVTSIKYALPGMTSKKRFNKDNAWGLPSTRIGNSLDSFGRDVFNGKFDSMSEEEMREALKDYSNSTVENYIECYHALKAFEQRLLDKGQVIVRTDGTNQITTKGILKVKVNGESKPKQVRVAGTLDVLAIDKEGNLHIYDFKTSRKELTEERGKDKGYDRQLSMYADFLENEYNCKVADISIIPVQCEYPTPNGTDGEGNPISHAEVDYREQRPGSNQLEVKNKNEDVTSFREFKEANFKVGKEFPLNRLTGDALTASYENMTEVEKEAIIEAVNDQSELSAVEESITPEKVEAAEPVTTKKPQESYEESEELIDDLFAGLDFENTEEETPGTSIEEVEHSIDPENSVTTELKNLEEACRGKK